MLWRSLWNTYSFSSLVSLEYLEAGQNPVAPTRSSPRIFEIRRCHLIYTNEMHDKLVIAADSGGKTEKTRNGNPYAWAPAHITAVGNESDATSPGCNLWLKNLKSAHEVKQFWNLIVADAQGDMWPRNFQKCQLIECQPEISIKLTSLPEPVWLSPGSPSWGPTSPDTHPWRTYFTHLLLGMTLSFALNRGLYRFKEGYKTTSN